MPAPRAAAVGRGGHGSGRFPHVSFGTKELLCAQQQRGHSQRRFVPTCLPITPTHGAGESGWEMGKSFARFQGPAGSLG